MIKISDVSKKLLLYLFALCVIAFGLGCVFIPKDGSFYLAVSVGSYGLGLAFGYVFCALKQVLLERAVEKSLDMDKETAAGYARLQFMFRYFLTFIVLAAAAVIDCISLLGAVMAVLLVQPAAYLAGRKIKDIKESS
ncbi:MAG: ATP synthase subunit I [Clostridiales bacterium]|nr:ATP synthase subunit I [Clostridiales bacterium]